MKCEHSGYLFKNFHGKYFPGVCSSNFSYLKHLYNTNTKAITYYDRISRHKLNNKVLWKRDEIIHKLQHYLWEKSYWFEPEPV